MIRSCLVKKKSSLQSVRPWFEFQCPGKAPDYIEIQTFTLSPIFSNHSMQSSTQILKGKVVWGQNSTWVLTWRKLVTYWQLLFLLYLMFHLLLRRQLTGENLADADFRGWAKWAPFKGDGGIWWSERFQCWHHIAQWIEHPSRDSEGLGSNPCLVCHYSFLS